MARLQKPAARSGRQARTSCRFLGRGSADLWWGHHKWFGRGPNKDLTLRLGDRCPQQGILAAVRRAVWRMADTRAHPGRGSQLALATGKCWRSPTLPRRPTNGRASTAACARTPRNRSIARLQDLESTVFSATLGRAQCLQPAARRRFKVPSRDVRRMYVRIARRERSGVSSQHICPHRLKLAGTLYMCTAHRAETFLCAR